MDGNGEINLGKNEVVLILLIGPLGGGKVRLSCKSQIIVEVSCFHALFPNSNPLH